MNSEVLLERASQFSTGQERKEKTSERSVGLMVFTGSGENTRMLLMRTTEGFAPPTLGLDKGTNAKEAFGVNSGKVVEVARIAATQGNGAMRILSTRIDEPFFETPDNFVWVSKTDIKNLGEKTDAYKKGEMDKTEWDKDLGLDQQWYDHFRKIGIIDDPDQTQRGNIPDFIYGRTPIAGRYYGEEYKTTQAASKALASIGIDAYPKPDAPSITINSEDGDTFSFLGGDQLTISPYQAQLGFFREIERSHDIPMVNRFVYVAINNGYLGRTASIEVAFAMANNKRLIFSEPPTRFSHELPSEIVEVVNDNYDKFPHLPIADIPTQLEGALEHEIAEPVVSDLQKEVISTSMVELISDLRKKFGKV